jgi:hypothetical protein
MAQLPQPRLDQIFPLGGRAGSQVVVEIAGQNLDGIKTLHVDHPGFKAEPIKDNQFRVTIAANTPPGTYDLRAVGKYGITASRLFAVSRDLTEVRAADGNETLDKAQAVPLNTVVNGKSTANAARWFRFPAHKGERVTIECQAFRLDSSLRPVLVLSGPDSKELARSRPYFGRVDPLLDFCAPADGDYLVGLRDFTYTGDQPFRLVISNRPQLDYAFPPAVVPGEKVELTIAGRNLPGGKPDAKEIVLGQPLQQVQMLFTAPTNSHRLTYHVHVPSPTVNARGFQLWPQGMENALNPVTLSYATAPVTREQEPNDTPEQAQKLTLPTVVCGRFDRPGDVDWYSFTAKAGETIAFDLLCERLERPGDPLLLISNEKGEELASFDDHGQSDEALTQTNRDPLGIFAVPADGTYRVQVQERGRRGGPRYLYALRIGKPQPDFYPVVYHETANEPTCPVVHRGGSAFYLLCLNRRDGFVGQVTIEAQGLPRGVTCPPVHLGPQAEFAAIVFTAAPDAPEWAGAVRLRAWATINGRRVEREVACVQRRSADGGGTNNASRACREICLAVRSEAPYGLKPVRDRVTVAAGGTVEFKITLARHWSDFKDKVQLSGLKLPPGFEAAVAEVPADKSETVVRLTIAADVPPGTYTVVLRGDAQVPFAPESSAAKTNVRVADPALPVTVVVAPPAARAAGILAP